MAQVQLVYPKIPGSSAAPSSRCIAFEKYDGTNLHWVWQRKLGWQAFGVRRHQYDLSDHGIAEFNDLHPGLSEAVELFKINFADECEAIFTSQAKYLGDNYIVFTEFFGERSFAGQHEPDEKKI